MAQLLYLSDVNAPAPPSHHNTAPFANVVHRRVTRALVWFVSNGNQHGGAP